MIRILAFLTNVFPVWVAIASGLALFHPKWFTWFDEEAIVVGLAVIMLGMGITLRFDDFRRVVEMPRPIAVGIAGQFLIMPFLGWSIAHLLQLDTPFAVGLILVSCCPGGTASNVVTYIARANLALSVLMTMCSTMAAIVMTPLLTKWLAGTLVPVDALGLLWSTVQVVLLPVLIGLILNQRMPRLVRAVVPIAPLVSVIFIALICASIIGQNAESIFSHGLFLLLAVVLLHSAAFCLGYGFAFLLGYGPLICRTISIEVGMQNSGLGTVLANKHFANPETGVALAAVPCAMSAVCHSVVGSLLAAIWRLRPLGDEPRPTAPSAQSPDSLARS
ncbi:MAG: bile acid:sodium symporter family protein [Pirellulales bacterium]|nr:bile acid:sodium symporter family protein [Pirellulales bacterium]